VFSADGATILNNLPIKHPAARMVAQAARVLQDEVGDGTTSLVILTVSLLYVVCAVLARCPVVLLITMLTIPNVYFGSTDGVQKSCNSKELVVRRFQL
jgi:hypothetical protein